MPVNDAVACSASPPVLLPVYVKFALPVASVCALSCRAFGPVTVRVTARNGNAWPEASDAFTLTVTGTPTFWIGNVLGVIVSVPVGGSGFVTPLTTVLIVITRASPRPSAQSSSYGYVPAVGELTPM